MKTILVFGASGQTGQYIINEAKLKKLKVKDFNIRNPSIDELQKIMHRVNGVIIVFGPRPPYTDIFCEKQTKNILKAMNNAGVRRLICQTGAMIGDYPNNRSFLFKILSNRFRKSNPNGYLDRFKQEQVVINSSLDWTIIKPPRLTNTIASKPIKIGEDLKIGLFSSLSRKSLSRFIIGELFNPKYMQKAVFLKN